jgi:hypothetical protein
VCCCNIDRQLVVPRVPSNRETERTEGLVGPLVALDLRRWKTVCEELIPVVLPDEVVDELGIPSGDVRETKRLTRRAGAKKGGRSVRAISIGRDMTASGSLLEHVDLQSSSNRY